MTNPTLLLQDAANPIFQFAPFILVAVIFYFLIFMPMKKRQKKSDEMIANIKNGDKVITSSGIYGKIAGVKDKTFILAVADQVKIEVAKSAIAGLQSPDDNQ
jgi:preprotein translocase subunit YajC